MKRKSLPARIYRAAANIVEPLLPGGLVTPAHSIARKLTGRLEPEYDLIMARTKPGMTVVDAGANIGIYSYGFLGRGSDVVAFEPQPDGAQLIRAFYNAGFPRGQRRGKLEVRQEALGDAEGKALLHIPLKNGRRDAESASLAGKSDGEFVDIEVPVRPLDSLALKNVHIIKMDVEGFEVAALRGAVNTIRRCKPDILVEIEQRHHAEPIDTVFSALRDIVGPGYQLFFLDQAKALRPLSEFDVERQQLALAENPLDPRYVRNFFILHDR